MKTSKCLKQGEKGVENHGAGLDYTLSYNFMGLNGSTGAEERIETCW